MIINLRNALMTGKRLPYDAEVECLESTGTQWIDTGVYLASDVGISITGTLFTTSTTQYPVLCGAQTGSDDTYLSVNEDGSTTFFEAVAGGQFCSVQCRSNVLFSGKINFFGDGIVHVDDRTGGYPNDSPCTIPTINAPICAFAAGTPSGISELAHGRICSLKITKGGVLVRDFIPVRVGTVGYLYDRVSGKLFGNAGTGDFVLGPDVVPVEYIESHRTEWIDTGYKHSEPCEYIIDINGTPTANDSGILGSYSSDTRSFVLGFYNMFVYGFNQSNTRIDSPTYPAESNDFLISYKFDATPRRRTLSVNGWTGTAARTAYNSENVGVFATGPNGRYPSSIKCRYFKIRDANDETIHNFRPVRVGTEGAMMDVLTRRIYRNAGTGAFTYGNDLKYPIPAS